MKTSALPIVLTIEYGIFSKIWKPNPISFKHLFDLWSSHNPPIKYRRVTTPNLMWWSKSRIENWLQKWFPSISEYVTEKIRKKKHAMYRNMKRHYQEPPTNSPKVESLWEVWFNRSSPQPAEQYSDLFVTMSWWTTQNLRLQTVKNRRKEKHRYDKIVSHLDHVVYWLQVKSHHIDLFL